METRTYEKIGSLNLVNPLELDYTYKDETTILSNERYNIRVWGKNLKDIDIMLEDTLLFLKKSYYEANDEELTKDAQELKQNLKELFGND